MLAARPLVSGLRDNIAALQWVQANIHQFGGDPRRVTVYGQSTGGTNVIALYVSPLAVGLFQSAICLSSSPVLKGNLTEASAVNAEFISNANCSAALSVTDCLLGLSAAEAFAAIPSRWLGSYDLGLQNRSWPDAAVIIVDGDVVPLELNAALNAGTGSDVPLAFGHMAQEIDIGPISNLTALRSQQQFSAFLSSYLPALGWNDSSLISTLIDAYPLVAYFNNSQLTWETLVNDIIYCGGVHNLLSLSSSPSHTSPIYHHLIHYHPHVPTNYLSRNGGWLTSFAGHEWEQLLLLHSWPAEYEPTETDFVNAELLRIVWVDGMLVNAGLREADGFWTPFNAEWLDGDADDRPYWYTGDFRQGRRQVDVVANWRWEKCQLLDELGFAESGWAN